MLPPAPSRRAAAAEAALCLALLALAAPGRADERPRRGGCWRIPLEAIRRRIDGAGEGERAAALKEDLDRRRKVLEGEMRGRLLSLAARHGRPAAIMEGMASREVNVVAVERTEAPGVRHFVTEDEY